MDASGRSRLFGGVLTWAIFVLFEVALIGKFDRQETPVGIAIALLATVAAGAALRVGGVRYAPQASWLGFFALVARNVVRDTVVVFGALFRQLAGRPVSDAYRDVPFTYGPDDARSAARRALVVAGVSTSPNEIVIDLDRERGTLRVHAIAETDFKRASPAWPL